MNKKKKKILDIYAKNSTPEELFSTVMELIEKLADRINSVSLKVPDEMAITDIVRPLIPEIPKVIPGKDGKTPTSEELTELILPLIPEPVPGSPGKDGNIIEAKEIRDKLTELKGDDRLSVYALKDLEWLAQYKQQIQWNAVGATPQTTVSSGLTELDPLESPDGSNTVFTFTAQPNYILSDGAKLRINNGWTWNSGTNQATLNVPPQYSLWGEK